MQVMNAQIHTAAIAAMKKKMNTSENENLWSLYLEKEM